MIRNVIKKMTVMQIVVLTNYTKYSWGLIGRMEDMEGKVGDL